ncbi:hypothetical protein I7I50_12188 [Histoplasma capsulatum G186AR]|uniref:Uncharacterized protein n=1 Tax=Ajellomyces capsulatus TaxID=5037 RepID=A0A8H7YDH5_AJECA|nr:hypothetical protein I7I52_11499 [Histoplasma capsulatum]QSS70533.1 hypothetical protein I7I50_12188 [Histoplasma capsulatum G186AR]
MCPLLACPGPQNIPLPVNFCIKNSLQETRHFAIPIVARPGETSTPHDAMLALNYLDIQAEKPNGRGIAVHLDQ